MPIIYHARNSINDKVRSHYLCDKDRQTLFHYKRWDKSGMDNPEKLATLGTQDTG
jgi:GH43 family beta-xylosidase